MKKANYKRQPDLYALICCVVVGILLAPEVLAQRDDAPWKAAFDAGSPAIQYGFRNDGRFTLDSPCYEVRYVTYAEEAAFKFYVIIATAWSTTPDGFLYISPARIVFDPAPKFKKHAFHFSKTEIRYSVKDGGQDLVLSLPNGRSVTLDPWVSEETSKKVPVGPQSTAQAAAVNWMTAALSDFAKAKDQFENKTRGIFLYPELIARFKAEASEWRNLTTKPAMPEGAREHNVLAENAVQEKNLDKAIDEYSAALEIFPTWPEGQFNLALICGETGDYDCAVEHMQDYLELVPDAPDAQAAKDKLIIWRDKLEGSSQPTTR